MIFKYGWEPILIKRILIDFKEHILENKLSLIVISVKKTDLSDSSPIHKDNMSLRSDRQPFGLDQLRPLPQMIVAAPQFIARQTLTLPADYRGPVGYRVARIFGV